MFLVQLKLPLEQVRPRIDFNLFNLINNCRHSLTFRITCSLSLFIPCTWWVSSSLPLSRFVLIDLHAHKGPIYLWPTRNKHGTAINSDSALTRRLRGYKCCTSISILIAVRGRSHLHLMQFTWLLCMLVSILSYNVLTTLDIPSTYSHPKCQIQSTVQNI